MDTVPNSTTGRRLTPGLAGRRVLVIDDEPATRAVCRTVLEPEGITLDEAPDGESGLHAATFGNHDLVLLDVDLPRLQGPEVLRRLRATPPGPHLKVIMFSGHATGDEMARLLAAGADDYLAKPCPPVQFRERVKAALRLKQAQDQSDHLRGQLIAANRELEAHLRARGSDLIELRNALVLGLAELAGSRDAETGGHLIRLREYSCVLAEAASALPAFSGRIDRDFVAALRSGAPLHDIGKVAVPDRILLKPGPLTPEERAEMQRHTVVAGDMLAGLARRHGAAVGFLAMAAEIARSHHERWDGAGYPDRLTGEAIPLAARVVAIADVYDALRSRRPYKPPMDHPTVVRTMVVESPGHFDPTLLRLFEQHADAFDRVFVETRD